MINFNNHTFKIYNVSEDESYSGACIDELYYICKMCGVIYFKLSDTNHFYYSAINSKYGFGYGCELLSCGELIVKNILE